MRTFIALELPDDFADDVAALARQLSAAAPGRFSPRKNYHVTLAFLGDIGEAESRDAIAALDEACDASGPIDLRPVGLGHFGKPGDATLWMGLEPEEGLVDLAKGVREALSSRWLTYDDKAFRPHITLARRARLPKGALPALAFPTMARAERVTLFKSTLTKDGPIYKPLYSRELLVDPSIGAPSSSS